MKKTYGRYVSTDLVIGALASIVVCAYIVISYYAESALKVRAEMTYNFIPLYLFRSLSIFSLALAGRLLHSYGRRDFPRGKAYVEHSAIVAFGILAVGGVVFLCLNLYALTLNPIYQLALFFSILCMVRRSAKNSSHSL